MNKTLLNQINKDTKNQKFQCLDFILLNLTHKFVQNVI